MKFVSLTKFIPYLFLLLFRASPLVGAAPPPLIEIPPKVNGMEVQSKIVEFHGEEGDKSADPLYWYRFSQQYILIGNFQRAEKQLKHALKLDPDFQEAKIQLGFLYLFVRNYDSAYELFSEELEGSSCNRFALEGLYRVAQHLKNKKEEATKLLSIYYKLLSCDSSNCDYLFFLGHTLYRAGKKREAAEYFVRCLELCPEYEEASLLLSKITESAFESPPPQEIPPPIVERAKSVDISHVEAEIYELYGKEGGDSVNPLYWYKLARLYIKFNQLNKAKKQLDYAIELSPSFQQAIIQLGYLHLFQNDTLSAYKTFSDYSNRYPCDKLVSDALYKIALKFKKEKSHRTEVVKIFRYLVDCDPSNCDYLFYLGQALYESGGEEEAALYLSRSLEKCPEYRDAALLLDKIEIKPAAAPRLDIRVPKPIIKNPREGGRASHSSIVKGIHTKEDEKSIDPLYWYHLALVRIRLNQPERAERDLRRAIELSPAFKEAHIQLGYIQLWKGETLSAYEFFYRQLDGNCSDSALLNGLHLVAKEWLKEDERLMEVEGIYERLVACEPTNCDYLFFMGATLNKRDRYREADEFFTLCLERCPDYFDAALLLAKNHMKSRRLLAAHLLMRRYPKEVEALRILASIAYEIRDWRGMEAYSRRILCQKGEDRDAVKNLAYSLYKQNHFAEAKRELIALLNQTPKDDQLVKEYLYEVKPFTNPAIEPLFKLIKSKEQDPSLNAITVRTLYLISALTFHYPVYDFFKVNGALLFNRQREKDVYPPTGNNYNVYMSGGEVAGELLLTNRWSLKLSARELYSWSEGGEFFPFSNRCSFEPGSYFIYDSEDVLFGVGGHYESFVVKNFNTHRSELLRFAYTEARYGRKLRVNEKRGHFTARFSETFFRDRIRNRRHLLGFYSETNLPFLPKELYFTWLAEWSRFKELSRSYYSYDRQWLNEVGFVYRRDFGSCYYVELSYREKWRSSRDVFLPVGDTVFVAQRLFIRGYRPSIALGYRRADRLIVEVGGHYYYDTFPYWDNELRAKILWYF